MSLREKIDQEIMAAYEEGADSPRYLRARERAEKLREVDQAYRVLSHALNHGEQEMILEALMSEHPTLLGKLANVVMAAVNLRDGDGRLLTFNMTLGEVLDRTGWNSDTKLSEIRQPLI